MAMITKKTIVRALREAYNTPGTDSTPAAANTVKASNVSVSLAAENLKQEQGGSSLSPWRELVGARHWEFSCTVPIHGSGAAGTAPRSGELLLAAGMLEDVTASTSVAYKPASQQATVAGEDGYLTSSVYVYMDGLLYKLLYTRGSVKILLPVGGIPMFEFTMIAKYAVPTDVALPTDSTYESTTPVAVENRSFTMNSYAAVISNLELDLATEVVPVLSANDATGYSSIEVVNRDPGGSFDPNMELEATNDFWADFVTNETEMALSIQIGQTAGNICTITAPKCNYRGLTPGDKDGVRMYEAPFQCARSSGDDEIVITFT